MISPTHIKKHGLSTAEYKQLYPDDVLRIFTEDSRKKSSTTKKGKPNYKLRGRKPSKEHSDNISKTKRANFASGKTVHWNTGRTTPDDVCRKISEGNKGIVNIGNIRQREKKHQRIRTFAELKNCEILHLDIQDRTTAKCRTCGVQFTFNNQVFYGKDSSKKLCPSCEPRCTFVSLAETEILSFIRKEYSGQIIPNDRQLLGGKEIDIYLPELKIGIEYTGFYYHCEKQNPVQMHLSWKTRFAKRLGVYLITIFEDEWRNTKEIVKSNLRSILKLTNKTIQAEDCELIQPAVSDKDKFLTENHLRGTDASDICIGLKYDGNIVALSTFLIKDNEYIWNRFSYAKNITVLGATERVLAWFKQVYNKPLVTYSDLRWENNSFYEELGFKLIGRNEPACWFIDKKYSVLIPAQGEWDHNIPGMFDRIWDCGAVKWQLD